MLSTNRWINYRPGLSIQSATSLLPPVEATESNRLSDKVTPKQWVNWLSHLFYSLLASEWEMPYLILIHFMNSKGQDSRTKPAGTRKDCHCNSHNYWYSNPCQVGLHLWEPLLIWTLAYGWYDTTFMGHYVSWNTSVHALQTASLRILCLIGTSVCCSINNMTKDCNHWFKFAITGTLGKSLMAETASKYRVRKSAISDIKYTVIKILAFKKETVKTCMHHNTRRHFLGCLVQAGWRERVQINKDVLYSSTPVQSGIFLLRQTHSFLWPIAARN